MPTPQFERARLRLARELKGWSQSRLAEAVDLTPAALSQFESGATRPSEETLTRLSAALQVPLRFFGQPLIETHEGFFRSLRRTSVTDRRRARAIAYLAHDLVSAPATAGHLPELAIPNLPQPALDAATEQVERIAEHVRAAWKVPPGPVANVVHLLEAHGIVVIRLPLQSADVDAFSLPFPDHPVIVLGSDKDDRARSRFDGTHELGHLTMHGEQVWGLKEIETQAHEFAAAFLMPKRDILSELPTVVDWPHLFKLKQKWQVSLAALLRRARTLERITESQYVSAIKTASARGWRRFEPVSLGQPERPQMLSKIIASDKEGSASSGLPTELIYSIAAATNS
jgi:Zn-dependent peptidase ImmA (M78 family)/transcriptional regulator with XRE-family HTH domain